MNESGKTTPLLFGKYTEIKFAEKYLSLVAIVSVLGLFVPEDVMSNNSKISDYVIFLSNYIPMLNVLDVIGMRVEENKFTYAVLWVGLIPVVPLMFYVASWRIKHKLIGGGCFGIVLRVLIALLMCYEIFTFHLTEYLANDGTRAARFWFGSDVGATLFSMLGISWVYFWVGGVPAFMVALMRGELCYLSDGYRQ